MNILIYYQNNGRSVFLESLIHEFIKRGNKVYLLTTCQRGDLHKAIENIGAQVNAYAPGGSKFFLYLKHFIYLVRFCKMNKIEVVYSHLQFANLIAVYAQRFIPSKVFPCRHHADDVMLGGNKNAMKIDRLINKHAKKLIVVSKAVKGHMVSREHVDPDKIKVIKLGYDFDRYPKPDQFNVDKIKRQMSCKVLLIVMSRMTVNKNIVSAVQVLINICNKGMDVKMIIMDDGPERQNIKKLLKRAGMEQKVLFTGFVKNSVDYLKAADLLLHPSVSEASNQVIREAGFLSKPFIVCKGVGDFDEYVVNNENGFVVDKSNVVKEMTDIVERYYGHLSELEKIGSNMRDTVISEFKIDPVCEQYLGLMLN